MKKKAKFKNFIIGLMGEEWRVEYITPVIDPLTGNEACGLCDYAKKTLFINSALSASDMDHTFIHELFHAYVRRSGIYNANLSHELEEIIADQFALIIVELFDLGLH